MYGLVYLFMSLCFSRFCLSSHIPCDTEDKLRWRDFETGPRISFWMLCSSFGGRQRCALPGSGAGLRIPVRCRLFNGRSSSRRHPRSPSIFERARLEKFGNFLIDLSLFCRCLPHIFSAHQRIMNSTGVASYHCSLTFRFCVGTLALLEVRDQTSYFCRR